MLDMNKNRIDKRFDLLKKSGDKALIPFITAGDPDLETTILLVQAMEKAGADIIELGIPYSDPISDGPVIQESSARALNNGVKIPKIMNMVKEIRKNSEIPLVYLTYYNTIFKYGIESFLLNCSEVGIDGIIIPDLPIEEREDITTKANVFGIYIIPLIAPTSQERIRKITENAKGFVYCISTNGVTGIRNDISTDIAEYMHTIGLYTDTPKILGFGISGAEMVKKYKSLCDGIIVGSALIKKIAEASNREESIKAAVQMVSEMKNV